MMDKLLAKVPAGLVNNPEIDRARRFVSGAAAPIVGVGQLAANVLPDSTGIPQAVNRAVKEQRQTLPPNKDLIDRELVGNVLSPANLAIALRGGTAVSLGERAIQGGKIGGLAGLTSPVEVGESGKYWGSKVAQTALSTVGGAVLGPIIGKVGDAVVSRINSMRFNPANAAKEADEIISGALRESGQKIDDIPAAQVESLRQQVTAALSQGQKLDAAAALRKADFDAEKIVPTLGQVTRDPMQYAAEQNVRGVKGAGEKLTERLATGNQQLSAGIGAYGTNAAEAPVAASKLADALKNYDVGKRAAVTKEYSAARESTGKDLEIPMQGLAQDYADILHRYAEKVPGGVRNAFEDFGLGKGKQTKVFTFEEADKLLKTINDNWSPESKAALGELNRAVKNAASSVDASGGPFAPAVKLARERFAEHEAIPALRAAAAGKVDDTFVNKYVINSRSTEEVQKLAAVLKKEAPEAFQETRQQIGAHLSRAAFGENVAGDKAVAQESYNRALRNIGTAKLNAFFEPNEVEQMKRLGRIASYQGSPPAASASNYSNTASALANLLRAAGGILPIGKGSVQHLGDVVEAKGALNAKVPIGANLTPDQRAALARLLSAGSGGAGFSAAGAVGQ